jgi:methionine-rich copper-binding protein CopC
MTPRYLYPSLVTHRTSARLLLLAVGALAGALLGAAPAAAHTTLKQSDPAAGSTVQALPEVVRLTFSDTLPIVPTVTVRDDAGTVVNSSPISPRGNTVLQPVKSTKGGKFTVTWELTSADGHKTSGSFAFTVAAAPSDAPSPTAPVVVTATPTPEAPQSSSAPPAASALASTAVAVPTSDSSGTGANWLLWTAVTVVLLGAAVTIVLLSRRRAARPPSA